MSQSTSQCPYQDDDRTVVDGAAHHARPEPETVLLSAEQRSFGVSGPIERRRAFEWRPLSLLALAIGLMTIPTALAYRTHQTVRELKTELDQLARAERVAFRTTAANLADDHASARNARPVAGSADPLSDPRSRVELERHAIDSLAANDYDRAIGQYRRLAELFPDEPAFAAMVEVLLVKHQCSSPGFPGGFACR